MASPSSLLTQINDDYLTCQICMEPYRSPKVLACQHSFCTECLESCETTAQGSYLLCPLCRQRTVLGLKGIQGLKNNFVLSSMLAMLVEWRKKYSSDYREDAGEQIQMCQTCPLDEAAMATYQCIDCLDHLCADCAAFHSRTKLTRDHEVVSLQDIESGKHKDKIQQQEKIRCNIHQNNKLEKYCPKCDSVACSECINETHQGHPLVPIDDEIVSMHKDEVAILQKEMEDGIDQTRQTLEQLLQIKEEERFELVQMEQEIERLSKELIAMITEKRTEMLNQIEGFRNRKYECLSAAKEKLEMQLKCLLNCAELSSYILQDGALSELLSLKKHMSQTLEELKESSSDVEKQYMDSKSHNQKLRFTPGNQQHNIAEALGTIQQLIERDRHNIRLNIFTSYSSATASKSSSSEKITDKIVATKENHLLNYSPCNSSTENHKYDEVLYVDLPEETSQVKPTPIPRKSRSVLDLSNHSPVRLPKPAARTDKIQKEKPYVVDTPECYKITRMKGTVPIPVKAVRPVNKVLPNHYPTAPHRTRNEMKPSSSSSKTTASTDDEQSSSSGSSSAEHSPFHKPKKQPITIVRPMVVRAAPPPPVKPSKKIIPQQIYKTIPGPKAKPPKKKNQAPLPPSTPRMILKAEISRVFGSKGQGYRDFQGPPQGIAMTIDKLLVLDGEGQQVIIFNAEGFYTSRFSVNIPNQGKSKPTGITISLSYQIYVLYKNLVTVWSLEGTLLTLFGHRELVDAHDIATDSQERVIVADQGKHQIVIFSKRGNKLLQFGSYGENDTQFQSPRYICTTSRDEIVVSDHHNHAVKIFNSNGKLLASCHSKDNILKYPESLTTIWPKKGQAEILLVADEGNNRISAYSLHGEFLYHVLEPTNDLGLRSPQSIATSDSGKLVIFMTNSIQGRIYDLHVVASHA